MSHIGVVSNLSDLRGAIQRYKTFIQEQQDKYIGTNHREMELPLNVINPSKTFEEALGRYNRFLVCG